MDLGTLTTKQLAALRAHIRATGGPESILARIRREVEARRLARPGKERRS